MIKSVHLTNFFSFRDCEITLEPDVTVLVGINGSGKTNLLRAFELLKAGMDGKLRAKVMEWGRIGAICFRNRIQEEYSTGAFVLSFTIVLPQNYRTGEHYKGQPLLYTVELQGDGPGEFYVREELEDLANEVKYFARDINGGWLIDDGIRKSELDLDGYPSYVVNDKRLMDVENWELVIPALSSGYRSGIFGATDWEFRDSALYADFDTRPRSQMRQSIQATGLDVLDADGANLFQILNTIQLKSTEAGDAIERDLKEVNPQFDRLQFQPLGQGGMLTYLREVGLKTPIPAAHVSDGTLRYLCLLAIAHNPDRGRLICLDEPERGLHPDMLAGVARLLLDDGHAKPDAPRHTSYVVATHSPQLLSRFPLRCLRIFEKDENNQTVVRQFGDDEIARFREWYETFDAGSLWLKGELGGTRW